MPMRSHWCGIIPSRISPAWTWSRPWPSAGGRDGAARPHLPVRVDAAINAGMVARAVELMPADLPVFVLPMMPVGKSNEHHAYPGTLSLSHETCSGSGSRSAKAC